uniref:Uncharacterized protein n=1 Tax=Spongospora subterranea TaxID=70186 RepID=A0A0H5QJW5_9EUKA|eukprot:CRZ01927.1 hypothetical protein [Spongospora subterranea]
MKSEREFTSMAAMAATMGKPLMDSQITSTWMPAGKNKTYSTRMQKSGGKTTLNRSEKRVANDEVRTSLDNLDHELLSLSAHVGELRKEMRASMTLMWSLQTAIIRSLSTSPDPNQQ